jgi:hypothetical protein
MGEVKNQIAQIFLRYGLALLNSKTISVDETTFADSILSLPSLREALEKAEKWDALTKKYPHFCTRFDPEIDGEVKDETK